MLAGLILDRELISDLYFLLHFQYLRGEKRTIKSNHFLSAHKYIH